LTFIELDQDILTRAAREHEETNENKQKEKEKTKSRRTENGANELL